MSTCGRAKCACAIASDRCILRRVAHRALSPVSHGKSTDSKVLGNKSAGKSNQKKRACKNRSQKKECRGPMKEIAFYPTSMEKDCLLHDVDGKRSQIEKGSMKKIDFYTTSMRKDRRLRNVILDSFGVP